jgi:hypothetical protein
MKLTKSFKKKEKGKFHNLMHTRGLIKMKGMNLDDRDHYLLVWTMRKSLLAE